MFENQSLNFSHGMIGFETFEMPIIGYYFNFSHGMIRYETFEIPIIGRCAYLWDQGYYTSQNSAVHLICICIAERIALNTTISMFCSVLFCLYNCMTCIDCDGLCCLYLTDQNNPKITDWK